MSAIKLVQHRPDAKLGIVARFSLSAGDHDASSPHAECYHEQRRVRGVAGNNHPNGPLTMVRRFRLKGEIEGALKDWCETHHAFVTVTKSRLHAGRRIVITIWHRPELVVDFRLRFT